MDNTQTQNYEYMLHWWGGCNDTIKEKYGYENYLYFDTAEEREKVRKQLLEYGNLGLGLSEKEGILTHKDTVACMTMRYNNKDYYYEENFGKEYGEDSARFMFFEGNYSCDCNKSLFLNRTYGDECPELEHCGDEIEIIDFRIEYR